MVLVSALRLWADCAQLDGGITRDGGWVVAVGVHRPLQPAGWRAGGALRDALEDACGTDVAQGRERRAQ